MRHSFHSPANRESRLLGFGFSFGPNANGPEQFGMQQNPERRRLESLRMGQVPNAMNQRMNTTSERLGKTRDQYMEELRQQYKYLSQLIDTARTYTHRIAQKQRGHARGQMAISPRYGGGDGPMGMEQAYERQGAEQRFVSQFGSVQELEQQRDYIRIEMAKIHAERQAGIPDPALNVPEGTPPQDQEVGRLAVLTTGERPPSRVERFAQNATPEQLQALQGLPEQIQEVAAATWESVPENQKQAMMSLMLKMQGQDEETLRQYFALYFKDNVALDPATVKIDDKDPAAVKAKALADSLTPEERAVAQQFLKKGVEIQDGGKTFEDLSEVTKARVLKYVKRWNKAKPDSGQKLIAEGMLYLDGVDVENSVKGEKIEKEDIKMLPREGRFMGFIAGWIKLIMGWKKLLGTMQTSQKPSERKDPSEMTKEERDNEIKLNNDRITEIKGRVEVLPDEIKKLEKEIGDLPADNTEDKQRMTRALDEKKKELADAPAKIQELEERNAALAGAVETKKSEISESSRVAFETSVKKATELSATYGVTMNIASDASQNYDRSLIVLEKVEQRLSTLTPDQLAILKAAKPDAVGEAAFSMEGVEIIIKADATEAKTLLKETLKSVLDGGTEIANDPRVRFAAEKERFKADFAKKVDEYIAQMKDNPVMKGMLEGMGLDVNDANFQEKLKAEMEKVILIVRGFADSVSLDPNAEGKYRIMVDLRLLNQVAEKAVGAQEGQKVISGIMTQFETVFPMTIEASRPETAVSKEYYSIDDILGKDPVNQIRKPLEKSASETGPVA